MNTKAPPNSVVNITSLPGELFADIIAIVLQIVGMRKAVRLRATNKIFAGQIMRAIYYSYLYYEDGSVRAELCRRAVFNLTIHPKIMGALLLAEMEQNYEHLLLSPIWQEIQFMDKTSPQGKGGDHINRHAICEVISERLNWAYGCHGIGFRYGRRMAGYVHLRFPAVDQEALAKIALSIAIIVRDELRVKSLLAEHSNINTHNEFFGEPLQLAAKWSSIEIFQSLLDAGADVHTSEIIYGPKKDWLDWPHGLYVSLCGHALEVACLAGREDIVKLLTNSQYGRHLSEEEYSTGMESAARAGHSRIVSNFMGKLYSGLFTLPSDLPRRILILASWNGHGNMVSMMLKEGVGANTLYNPRTKYNSRDTRASVLELAAINGHSDVMRILLDHGADRDYTGDSKECDALTCAATRGHEEAVQVLLDYGANINMELDGKFLLQRVVRKGQSHMVKFLLQKGADLKIPLEAGRKSLGEQLLVDAVHTDHHPIVRILVDAGVPPNNSDQLMDPVLNAIAYGQSHVLKTLIALGGEEVDPMKSCFAEEFKSGKYPLQKNDTEKRIQIEQRCQWRGRY